MQNTQAESPLLCGWSHALLQGWRKICQILSHALELFAASSGLCANTSNSAIFIAGVPTSTKNHIAQPLDIPLGSLPVRYLGVPLTSKKISVADCEVLVDKMTARIRTWSSKSLSCATRLQLVSAVLMSINSYWCQLFIIPKAFIKKINAICRSYMRHADPNNNAPGNVKWENLCKPKRLGGLGVWIWVYGMKWQLVN